MTRIGFLGLGNMGLPMARNLVRAGHPVRGYDVKPTAVEGFAAAGGIVADDMGAATVDAEVVITMLPSGVEVRDIYLGPSGVLATADTGTLLVDCSTIDV